MSRVEDSDQNGVADPGGNDLQTRLATAEAEVERLRREVARLTNESLNSWLGLMDAESKELSLVYSTLSWRVTKPLRLARKVQIKVREIGVLRTVDFASGRLKQIARRP